MKRVLIIAIGAALACATTAQAAPAALSEAFHNTIVSTYPDGRQARLWLAEGGTYTAEGRRHDRSNGTWKLKGADQICLKQSHPATVPISYCTAVPSGGVGATWAAKSVFGDPLKVKLVDGR